MYGVWVSLLQLDSDDGILHVRQHVFIELIFISVLVFIQYNMYIKKVMDHLIF